MFRAYILVGFTFFLFQMHLSGNITKYINMKYAYLSLSAAIILAFLSVVQVIVTFQKEFHLHHDDPTCIDEHCSCSHDHDHEHHRWIKVAIRALFILPLVTGLFFPIAMLDSSIVEAKGFHFPVAEPGSKDPFMQRQFLKPDTSIYYGADGYQALINKEKVQYENQQYILLNDSNFLKAMEVIYNNPGDFIGKSLSYKGFVFHDSGQPDYFLFRFGIIHCVADSGVYGMLIKKPNEANWKNDDWIEVEGTIKTQYYQPFHASIPVLEVEKWTKVDAPKEQYVYRGTDS